MKHKNCPDECAHERNIDLLRAYRRQLASCTEVILSDIYLRVVNSPCRRFWVSEWRAAIVLSRMFRGDDLHSMSRNYRDLYHELFRRAQAIRALQPDISYQQLAFIVVRQPAPRFYLSPKTACAIITRIKHQICQAELDSLRSRHCRP